MYKVKSSIKRQLESNYEKACNQYLHQLMLMWELSEDSGYGFWVGDDVGGTYCYGDDLFFQMDDIIFCVMNDVEEKEYREWMDYNSWANEFNQSTPSLKAWMKGCPRCSKETMEHLTNLKREFEEACEDASSRLVNQSF